MPAASYPLEVAAVALRRKGSILSHCRVAQGMGREAVAAASSPLWLLEAAAVALSALTVVLRRKGLVPRHCRGAVGPDGEPCQSDGEPHQYSQISPFTGISGTYPP